jgi:hypothetical protein
VHAEVLKAKKYFTDAQRASQIESTAQRAKGDRVARVS